MALANATRKTIRASVAVLNHEVLALWLGIDPDDVLGMDVSSGELHLAYRDIERGLLTPPGGIYAVQRRLRVTTHRKIEDNGDNA